MAIKERGAVERNGHAGVYPAQQDGGPEVAADGGLVTVECTLTGVSPLLQNAMTEGQLLLIRDKTKKPKTAAKPSPREEADGKFYRTADGAPCVPHRMLYAAFVAAGQYVRLDGKRQVSTATKTVLPGCLLLITDPMPLYVPGTDTPAPSEVDIQQGRNPNGGEAVCIVRPRFDRWEVRCELEIDQNTMPLNMARELVDKAGKMIGVGDFRPQRRGPFGRFCVTSWKVKQ